jgi:hypothetical protein
VSTRTIWRTLKKTAKSIFADAAPKKDTTLWDVFSRHQRLAREIPPLQPHETAAATLLYPKTAALLFDRLRIAATVVDPDAPLQILFSESQYSGLQYAFSGGAGLSLRQNIERSVKEDGGETEAQFFRNVDDMQRALGRSVVPIYRSGQACSAAYAAGAKEMLALAMNRVPFLSESALDWEQVMDVRADSESRDSIRQFFRWADETLLGKPEAVIADEIRIRFERYRKALRKHGVATRVESLAALLDVGPKAIAALGAAAAHYAGLSGFLAATASGALITAEMSVKLAKVLINYDEGLSKLRSQHAEVAFLAHSS